MIRVFPAARGRVKSTCMSVASCVFLFKLKQRRDFIMQISKLSISHCVLPPSFHILFLALLTLLGQLLDPYHN